MGYQIVPRAYGRRSWSARRPTVRPPCRLPSGGRRRPRCSSVPSRRRCARMVRRRSPRRPPRRHCRATAARRVTNAVPVVRWSSPYGDLGPGRRSRREASTAVSRTRARSGGPGAGELLQDAPDLAPLGPQVRLGPAQSRADVGHGRERTRLAARLVPVQPLVGEVHEHHQRAVLLWEGGPGMSAVLDDPAAHVPRRGQQRLLRTVGVPPHQGAPARLGGARFGPPHLVAGEPHVVRVPVVRGGQGRVDGRGPGPGTPVSAPSPPLA
ncbi:hypothetical protein SVIOM74S_09652 [Streptomyces violarus]